MYSLAEIITILSLLVLAYMVSWFVLAVILKRRDVVDSAWGLGFVLVAWSAYLMRNNDTAFTFVSMLLVTVWGLRLFLHLTTRNWKKAEDYRYQQMGALSGLKIWFKTFVTVFLLQGILLLIISAPVIAIAYADHVSTRIGAGIGLLIWLFGIMFEATADYQLRRFIRAKHAGIMQNGLWRYSRHPNYFGEITAWWGASIVAASFGQWWGVIGALLITALIVKVSGIPLLEKRYADNPKYQKYARQTSILIPLPVKKYEK